MKVKREFQFLTVSNLLSLQNSSPHCQMFASLGKQMRRQQHRTSSSKLFSFCHKFIKIITLIFENVHMYNVFNLFCYKTTDVSRYLLNKCFSSSWQHLNGRNLADIYHYLKLINHLFKEEEKKKSRCVTKPTTLGIA